MDGSVSRGGAARRLLPIVVLIALLAWALAAAGPAAAAPSEPTLSLTDLQSAIATAGPGGLDGYFKTVLQGDTISYVPVEIVAVAQGQNATDGSAMILFQITADTPAGQTVLSDGGLAEGMSGSPLFVGDVSHPQPTDDLVGAVSQGDSFTTSGLGLATPIDYMASIETKYQVAPDVTVDRTAATAPFAVTGPVLAKTRTAVTPHRVRTSAGSLSTVVMARSAAVARTLHPKAGTAVFVPLSAVEIGGLPASSQAFKRIATALAKRGVAVHAAGAAEGDDPAFTTDLVSGASVAAVIASGDVWGGFFGTVTYVDDDVLVAFGHPADLDGPSGLDMANADVYGVWSDSYIPYKVYGLGAIRGLFTQDRTYGIAGQIGAATPEVPVSASVSVGSGPAVPSLTMVPQWVADSPLWGSMIVADACYFPVFQATDAEVYPGHATMDSTVTVSDPSNTPYTTEMDNVFDDTSDVGQYAGMDVADMFDYLLSNPNGTAPATASSVTFTAHLTPADATLQVLDFSVPGGLKHGRNTIRTLVRAYGEKGTHEEDLTLFVPADVATSGSLSVYDSNGANSDPPSDWFDGPRLGSAIPDSETLPDLVHDVDGWLLNDSLNATLTADVPNDYVVPVGPDGQPINIVTTSRAMIENGTTWFVQGDISKQSAAMRLRPSRPFAARGRTVKLSGTLDAEDSNGTVVALYRGTSTTPFALAKVHVNVYGEGTFSVNVKMGKATTKFKAVWDGSDGYLGATTSCTVHLVR